MTIRYGLFGLSKMNAAQRNPELIRSYASALAPFLGDLVSGDNEDFASIRQVVAEDPVALRELLAVLVGDSAAGQTILDAGRVAMAGWTDDAFEAWRAGADVKPALSSAGKLLGSISGAVELTGVAGVDAPESGGAMNEVVLRLATAMVPRDPDPAIVRQYLQGGKLLGPAAVSEKFGSDQMSSYYLTVEEYVSAKGFGWAMSGFVNDFVAVARPGK